MKEFLQKITKRELLYIVGFMAYNLFILAIWKLASFELLVQQVAFAASLVAILLAIFVMIYAWQQGREIREQTHWVRVSLKQVGRKLSEIERLERKIIQQIVDNSKINEGMQLISQGLKQLKQQKLPANTVEQIEVLEQKNQALMNHVVGLSDLSMIYHTDEINSVANVLNTYAIGDWFALKEIIKKMRTLDPAKKDKDVQNMVLFYLSHLNLLGYIDAKNNQYARTKYIPIVERRDKK